MSLNQFRLSSYLGAGSTGKVFRAEDRVLGRAIAVKIFPQSRSGATEAFLREARLSALLEHPFITRLYQVGRWGSWLYIAMELVDGGNAGQLVAASGPLPVSRAAQLCAQAAEALAFAHARGIVHCDVKPANLLLTRGGDCKLSDFGLARLIDRFEMNEETIGFVGTPLYLSPEMAQGVRAESPADIYSLGATLWHLLCGAPPFSAGTAREIVSQHVRGRLPDIRVLRPDLPPGLATLIHRSLAKNPADRVPTAFEFASALKVYVTPDSTTARLDIPSLHEPVKVLKPRRLSGRFVKVASLLAGCAAVVGTTIGLTRTGRSNDAVAQTAVSTVADHAVVDVAPVASPVVRTFSRLDEGAMRNVITSKDTRTYAFRGVVKSVTPSSTGKTLRVNFEQIPARGFYAVCLSEVVDAYAPGAPGSRSKLVGRSVTLRGTLRGSPDGPRIILRNLDQVNFTGGSP